MLLPGISGGAWKGVLDIFSAADPDNWTGARNHVMWMRMIKRVVLPREEGGDMGVREKESDGERRRDGGGGGGGGGEGRCQ